MSAQEFVIGQHAGKYTLVATLLLAGAVGVAVAMHGDDGAPDVVPSPTPSVVASTAVSEG